jgi:predicted ATPase/class 3 adenylate cyclase
MRCPSCLFDNPEGMKFCGRCAAPFTLPCPRCGFQSPPQFKFCGHCATPLTEAPLSEQETEKQEQRLIAPESPIPSPPSSHSSRTLPEAERRHLTVMFCDQVDSVSRSQRLDPEDFRALTRQYQHLCAQVIRECEGHIAQYHGDGLLAYFGYPAAHEDDARRAVRAGLGIMTALPRLNAHVQQTLRDLHDFPLQLRIGIHSGVTVVGAIGTGERRELVALGETPNIAARLQGIAPPNTVVISAYTYRLTAGFFECRALGPQQLKGITLPLSAYHVVQESKAQSRFEVATAAGLTPLVGRKEELGLLLERWEQVKEGQGGVILLSGEAGVGKSRLLKELKEQLTTEAPLWLELHCSPYYQHSALYPIIDLLQRFLRFRGEDSPQEKLSKLETALHGFGFPLPEIVPLFTSLLSLPLPAHYVPLTLTPQRQRQKLKETLLALLLALTKQQPVLLVAEDLHWADPSTLELLSFFVDHGPIGRSLILLTFRPELHLGWATRSDVTSLTLGRLSRKQVAEMVVGVTKGKTLPAEVLQQVVTKTDGIPLFVEELTKTVLESGLLRERADRYELTGPLLPVGIPATLHDSLLARLDRLGLVKEIAQLGATLGREFSYELLQAVSPLDESVLQTALNQLVEAEFLYRRTRHSHDFYLFKHALIQEAAYQSLLKSTRQQSHKQIAQVLQARFPEVVETQPELLAHHCAEAGLTEQALPYWQRAGQRAIERSANVEAAHHLTKGLELLKTLPDTPERAQHELALQAILGPALMVTRGYGAPEVEKIYSRARQLCQQVGDIPQLFPVLFGQWAFYSVRGMYTTARELGEHLLRLAQSVQDPALLLEAHTALGNTLSFLGDLCPAREHLEQRNALYNSQQHRSHAFIYGQDPGVNSLSYEAFTLWLLGYPEQAQKRSQEALALAQELSHPFSLAFALSFTVFLRRFLREVQTTQELAETVFALSAEQGFPLTLVVGLTHRGWALTLQGQEEEGIAQIQQGLATWQATGAELFLPYLLSLLVEVYGQVRRPKEGLAVLDEAQAIVHRTGECFYEAELYRLKGELVLQSAVHSPLSEPPNTQHLAPSSQAEAEAYFLKAIEIARQQQAKSLELRAATSLSRLWQCQGKKAEARQLLAAVYNWFTEGVDTADLQEARALLDGIV